MIRKIRATFANALSLTLLAVFCFIQAPASAATPPVIGGGANIFIDFTNPNAGRVTIVGGIPSVANLDLNGQTVDINLSGFQRGYTLNADGLAVNTVDLFELHDTPLGYVFVLNSLYDDILTTFAPAGIANADISSKPITLNESITFNGNTYASDISGFFYASAGNSGRVFLGSIKVPANPLNPQNRYMKVRATPNPAQVNQTIAVKATVSLKNMTAPVVGTLFFGDFTTPVRAQGDDFESMLKAGVSHSYTQEGVYTARLILAGADEIAETHIYVVVGKGFQVNSRNGAISQLTKSGNGAIVLNLGVQNIPGAVNALTTFTDLMGRPAGKQPSATGKKPAFISGLSIGNSFASPGIYVAESMAVDDTSAMVGKVRKTIAISAADIASSQAVQAQNAVASRDTATTDTDNAITFTNMKGKFVFTSPKADSVIFNGTFTLPPGYMPKNPAGNNITVSMGTVIDMVHLDSKGRLTLPTALSRITRYKLAIRI